MKSYFFDGNISGIDSDGNLIADRAYLSKDHADFYKGMFSTGVLGGLNSDALKVTETVETQAGVTIRRLHVGPGRCMIEGYQGDADETDVFTVSSLEDGRYRIVARLDNNEDVRDVHAELLESHDGEYPALVRDGNIYDLCLAQFRMEGGVPLDLEDTRTDPQLCGFSSINNSPAYYPPTDLPQLLWQYALFPGTLTEEQIAEIESNPSLMALFRGSRTGKTGLTLTPRVPGSLKRGDPAFVTGGVVDKRGVAGFSPRSPIPQWPYYGSNTITMLTDTLGVRVVNITVAVPYNLVIQAFAVDNGEIIKTGPTASHPMIYNYIRSFGMARITNNRAMLIADNADNSMNLLLDVDASTLSITILTSTTPALAPQQTLMDLCGVADNKVLMAVWSSSGGSAILRIGTVSGNSTTWTDTNIGAYYIQNGYGNKLYMLNATRGLILTGTLSYLVNIGIVNINGTSASVTAWTHVAGDGTVYDTRGCGIAMFNDTKGAVFYYDNSVPYARMFTVGEASVNLGAPKILPCVTRPVIPCRIKNNAIPFAGAAEVKSGTSAFRRVNAWAVVYDADLNDFVITDPVPVGADVNRIVSIAPSVGSTLYTTRRVQHAHETIGNLWFFEELWTVGGNDIGIFALKFDKNGIIPQSDALAGVVDAVDDDGTVTVATSGVCDAYENLGLGKIQYVDKTTGTIIDGDSDLMPERYQLYTQVVLGRAISDTEILINPEVL